MTDDNFERNKHPFHISGNGSRFFDDVNFANETPVGTVDLNEVGFANPSLLNEFEPVSGGSVERFTLTRDEGRNDLVKNRNLIRKSEFEDIGVVGRPNLLDFAFVEHFSHALQLKKSAFEPFIGP